MPINANQWQSERARVETPHTFQPAIFKHPLERRAQTIIFHKHECVWVRRALGS